ncbi:hypothetical protein PIB30_106103, partial [Stylosanthes scabra]|nr:hypothetical protein [Stylosanthes scabra]
DMRMKENMGVTQMRECSRICVSDAGHENEGKHGGHANAECSRICVSDNGGVRAYVSKHVADAGMMGTSSRICVTAYVYAWECRTNK